MYLSSDVASSRRALSHEPVLVCLGAQAVEREWTWRFSVPAPTRAAFLPGWRPSGVRGRGPRRDRRRDRLRRLPLGRGTHKRALSAAVARRTRPPLWEHALVRRGVFACTVRAAKYELPSRSETCRSVVAVLELALTGVPRHATDAFCCEFVPPADVVDASVVTRR